MVQRDLKLRPPIAAVKNLFLQKSHRLFHRKKKVYVSHLWPREPVFQALDTNIPICHFWTLNFGLSLWFSARQGLLLDSHPQLYVSGDVYLFISLLAAKKKKKKVKLGRS